MAKSKILLSLKLLSWLGLIGLFIVISVSAVQKRAQMRCERLLVRFQNDKNLAFLKSSDIIREIQLANPSWSSQRLSQLKLNLIENAVKQNEYVKRAELFLDNQNQLNVIVVPKVPIARIHDGEQSYYLSENWDKMSLSENSSKRIVQILGRVHKIVNPISSTDSFINRELKMLLDYFDQHPIWYDMVDQIYVANNGKIELGLSFCDPIIQLGFIDQNFEKRISKLDNFCREAPKYQNLSEYRELDFQFSNQVIARKKITI